METELRHAALACLAECDASIKAEAAQSLAQRWNAGDIGLDTEAAISELPGVPGRPDLPELVDPLAVGRRSMGSVEGRAALIHALAHIEFNAIKFAFNLDVYQH